MLTERALERRLKRHLMKDRQVLFAPCVPGFEDVLEAEVASLPDVESVQRVVGGVSFAGPLDVVYHANLQLAVAHRVLLRIGDYLAQTFPMLFDHLRRIHWELYLGFQPTYSVRVTASESRLNLKSRIAETLADAIRSRCEELGLDPKPAEDAPIEIHLRLYRDRCKVSINTTGPHLHKRGIRTFVGAAPLRETIAAACLRAASAGDANVIVDPFCGSGAMVVEAARIAAAYPPGAERAFAFEHMPFFQPSKWERFREEAVAAARPAPAHILASDLDQDALRALRANLDAAQFTAQVEISHDDALTREVPMPAAGRALLATNMPYGKRVLSARDADALARSFAAVLAERARGYEVALITQHAHHFEVAPFRTLRRTEFRNGGLPVVFLHAAIESSGSK